MDILCFYETAQIIVNALDAACLLSKPVPANCTPHRSISRDFDNKNLETLHSAVSFPFEPTREQIAVKAINHYGDEVLKVFNVRQAQNAS